MHVLIFYDIHIYIYTHTYTHIHIDVRWCELGTSADASKLTYMHIHTCTYFLSYTYINLQTYIHIYAHRCKVV